MKYISVFSILCLLFILSSSTCIGDNSDERHYYIPFSNESKEDIYVNYSEFYPDRGPVRDNLEGISPGRTNKTLIMSSSWEWVFGDEGIQGNCCPLDTLMVFVFDAEQLDADDHNLEEALLVRYDLSLMDLKHLNWMLSYPPSPQMQDMKMFPPYEEVIANASQ